MKEREVETEILIWLNKQPKTFAFKINQSGFFDGKAWRKRNNASLNGIADILGIKDGKPLAIETKTTNGVVSKEQEMFLGHYRRLGGIAFVARSLDDVKNQFQNGKSELS